jgi:hypothetical protein
MYQFQAFFSYKRSQFTDTWHRKLMELIQYWLSQELAAQNVPIFFDTRSIDNGEPFDDAIREALKNSAVIIAVMSPLYFTSAICNAEIRAFMDREDRLGRPRGSLISCARFHDGERYPSPFNRMQSMDFSQFANPMDSFWNSIDAAVFADRIRDFSRIIAGKIQASPVWDPSFPVPPFDPNGGAPAQSIRRPAAYLGTSPP